MAQATAPAETGRSSHGAGGGSGHGGGSGSRRRQRLGDSGLRQRLH